MSSGPYRRHSCPASLRVRSGGYRLERARQRVRLARVVQPPASPVRERWARAVRHRKAPASAEWRKGLQEARTAMPKEHATIARRAFEGPGARWSCEPPRAQEVCRLAMGALISCVSASPGFPWLPLASPGLSPSLCLRPRPRGAAVCSRILHFAHEGVISRRTNLCCAAQSIAHIWRRRSVKRHTPCQQGSHNRPS